MPVLRALALCLLVLTPVIAAEETLRVEQSIRSEGSLWLSAPKVALVFTLKQPAEVVVRIGRHLASVQQYQSEFLAEPIPVMELKLGKLPAGEQSVAWDGNDATGQPVTETQFAENLGNGRETPKELTRQVPVTYYRASLIIGGKESASADFRFRRTPLDPNRAVPVFMGSMRATDGSTVLADRRCWRGRRYSADWSLDATFPRVSAGHSSDPVECFDAIADSHGNACFLNRRGLYRFDPKGDPLAWEDAGDFALAPYPIQVRNLLGRTADVEKETDKLKADGWADRWVGAAFDAQDNVYLSRWRGDQMKGDLQVFDRGGRFLHGLPLPEQTNSSALRFGSDGALWVATGSGTFLLDPTDGKLRKRIEYPTRSLILLSDGSMLLRSFHAPAMRRFDAAGEPKPFTAKEPQLPGGELVLRAKQIGVDPAAPFASEFIFGVAAGAQGDFFVSVSPYDDPNFASSRLLHFAADGSYLPVDLACELIPVVPGNVFRDQESARFELLVDSLRPADAQIEVHWTLTDFAGVDSTGIATVLARAGRGQSLPFTIAAPKPGWYRLQLQLREGGATLAAFSTSLARIASRRAEISPDSPFAMCWGSNFHLMGLAGVKIERVPGAYWGKSEVASGVWAPDPAENIQWTQGVSGWRRYAAKNGVLTPEGFSYGELWLGGSYPNCRIFSYDRFLSYSLKVVAENAGKGVPYYQFWNEPNFFWHVPGDFNREHFAMLGALCWRAVKARDKESLCISDGDAGGLTMQEATVSHGLAEGNDSAQIHYPGVTPLKWDEMTAPDSPESKVEMVRQLIALRDRGYPGKPIWNTEEGWWGAKDKTLASGAMAIPRVYLPQLAAGVDRLYWFAGHSDDDPTYLTDGKGFPWPAYVSYATMTRMVEGRDLLGPAELGKGLFGFVYADDTQAVLAAWSAVGPRDIELDCGTDAARVIDLMDRETTIKAMGGKLTLKLDQNAQYVMLPRKAWAEVVAKAELARRLTALQLPDAKSIPGAIAALKQPLVEASEFTRLFYLVRAAEQAALAGQVPAGGDAKAAKTARAAILLKEGADGYLRQSRIALGWTERLAHCAERRKGATAQALAWAVGQAAAVTQTLAKEETAMFPGLTCTAFIGEPGEIARIRAIEPKANDFATTIDEKFRFEIARKPGESVELELTAWNFGTSDLVGEMVPRLPAGWSAEPAKKTFTLKPGARERAVFTVKIPADAKPGNNSIGGRITCGSRASDEVHPSRVKVAP